MCARIDNDGHQTDDALEDQADTKQDDHGFLKKAVEDDAQHAHDNADDGEDQQHVPARKADPLQIKGALDVDKPVNNQHAADGVKEDARDVAARHE